MFGISQFTAIINPPQSCILAVGGVEKRLTLDPFQDFSLEEDTQQQSFSIESIMKVTMSCDHRVVDGALGAQFLQKLKEYLESPLLLVAF